MFVKILTSNLALKRQWKRNFAPFKKNFCFVIVIIIVIWKKKKKNIRRALKVEFSIKYQNEVKGNYAFRP